MLNTIGVMQSKLASILIGFLLCCLMGAVIGGFVAMCVFVFCDDILNLRGESFFRVTVPLVEIVWVTVGTIVTVISAVFGR